MTGEKCAAAASLRCGGVGVTGEKYAATCLIPGSGSQGMLPATGYNARTDFILVDLILLAGGSLLRTLHYHTCASFLSADASALATYLVHTSRLKGLYIFLLNVSLLLSSYFVPALHLYTY